jgi:hypothetical protein
MAWQIKYGFNTEKANSRGHDKEGWEGFICRRNTTSSKKVMKLGFVSLLEIVHGLITRNIRSSNVLN